MQSNTQQQVIPTKLETRYREGQYRYRITSMQASSDVYGPCELCRKHVSEVFHQVEERFFVVSATGKRAGFDGWNRFQCHSLFGHQNCLISRRRGLLSSTMIDRDDGRQYAVYDHPRQEDAKAVQVSEDCVRMLRRAGYDVRESVANPGKYRWYRTFDGNGQSIPPLDWAETVFDTPELAWAAASAIEGWSSAPVCCPHCGGKEITLSEKWRATSCDDADNTATLQEYQCRGVCVGRSFWA